MENCINFDVDTFPVPIWPIEDLHILNKCMCMCMQITNLPVFGLGCNFCALRLWINVNTCTRQATTWVSGCAAFAYNANTLHLLLVGFSLDSLFIVFQHFNYHNLCLRKFTVGCLIVCNRQVMSFSKFSLLFQYCFEINYICTWAFSDIIIVSLMDDFEMIF